MQRYSVTETQLNTNGAIGHISLDHGTDEAGAKSHYYMALASGLASGLIAVTVSLTMMDDTTGNSYTMSEKVNGTGVLSIEGGTNE